MILFLGLLCSRHRFLGLWRSCPLYSLGRLLGGSKILGSRFFLHSFPLLIRHCCLLYLLSGHCRIRLRDLKNLSYFGGGLPCFWTFLSPGATLGLDESLLARDFGFIGLVALGFTDFFNSSESLKEFWTLVSFPDLAIILSWTVIEIGRELRLVLVADVACYGIMARPGPLLQKSNRFYDHLQNKNEKFKTPTFKIWCRKKKSRGPELKHEDM